MTSSPLPTKLQRACSDPKEAELREQWHEAKAELDRQGFPETGNARLHFNKVDKLLADYVWQRFEGAVEADRKRHPKKKRNLPKGAETPSNGGRHLP